jgi:hypothetical protein
LGTECRNSNKGKREKVTASRDSEVERKRGQRCMDASNLTVSVTDKLAVRLGRWRRMFNDIILQGLSMFFPFFLWGTRLRVEAHTEVQ